MNLHEQMDAAWESYIEERGCYAESDDGAALAFGFRAALALIANPDDEMVERCAKALALEDHGVHPDDWANDEYIIEIGRENYRESARACLQAVGCE